MKAILYSVIILFFSPLVFSQTEECTVGVASGSATEDGRPMIWKTRDYSQIDNVVDFNDYLDYSFIFVATAGSDGVRMGLNEYGLAIANSSSTDLPDGSDSGYLNGDLIRVGLGTCKTVDEFEDILVNTNSTGRRTNGNFVIIDSEGGASVFEVGEKVYWRYDAADDPKGYILRTNFAEHGGGSSGIERFNRTSDLFDDFSAGDSINYKTILRYQMRDFSDENSDPYSIPHGGNISGVPRGYIPTKKSICRNTSVSAVVVTGILEGEHPELSTMWTMLGQPATTIALPYWPVDLPPQEATGEYSADLCDVSLQIKDELFDYSADKSLINTYKLLNGNGGGLWTKTFPYEDSVFSKVDNYLSLWRQEETLPANRMKFVEDSLASDAETFLQNCLYHVVSSPELPADNSFNAQIFPNPFNQETRLSYELETKTDVLIRIYSFNGQLIKSYKYYGQEPSKHYLTIGSGLPKTSGLFFLNITTNNKTQTLKLIRKFE